MRKTGIVILTILVAIGLMGGAAMAAIDLGEPAVGNPIHGHGNPAGGYGAWVRLAGGTGGLISCNGEEVFAPHQYPWSPRWTTGWTITIRQHASVAQWAQFSISATEIYWYVLKPGVYRTNTPIRVKLKSNGNVGLRLSGFGNMVNTDSPKDEIEVSYRVRGRLGGSAYSLLVPWTQAENVNGYLTIQEDQNHNWYEYIIASMINVEECDSACDYDERAYIDIVLEEQKFWAAQLLCSK